MGTQHLRVPYGLIRQLCYAGGQRLAPRVNKVPPPEPDVDAEHIPYTYSANTAPVLSSEVQRMMGTVLQPTSLSIVTVEGRDLLGNLSLGNLSNEAYRFFKGSMIKSSSYFMCRGCLSDESLKERRHVHMRECRPLMQAIEERIKRDKVCVVCNAGTSRETWKIPLCSEACVIKWRFSIPNMWEVARRFVLFDEPGLLRKKCESIQTTLSEPD